MKDTATALAAFLERLGRFFDIFDLSFIVSGATVVGAVEFIFYVLGLQLLSLSGWLQVATLLVASYVAGLICFALGRWLRMGSQKTQSITKFDSHFMRVLGGHGLKEVPEIASYLSRTEERGIWRLYVRLWAEARQTPDLSESVTLLNRYWVMAATYDGLSVALLAWIVAIAIWAAHRPLTMTSYILVVTVILGLVIMLRACSREAGRYVYYQVEELVGAIAALRGRASNSTNR